MNTLKNFGLQILFFLNSFIIISGLLTSLSILDKTNKELIPFSIGCVLLILSMWMLFRTVFSAVDESTNE